MSDPTTWASIPAAHDPRIGVEILDRAKVILAEMLPGCTARRYDFPIVDGYSPVQLCFVSQGPIVPSVALDPDKYYSSAGASVFYASMLEDPRRLGATFPGEKIPVSARFDLGPQTMASTIRDAISKVNFATMIAAGSIKRILAEYPRYAAPPPNFRLALCAVYLGRDDEARSLLQDTLRYAKEDGRPGYADLIADAESYLAKLGSDADTLRQELTATMESNWSHLKIVSA